MDNDYKHQQIIGDLGYIKGQLTGVMNRLDIANGRIGKCEYRLEKLETKESFHDGERSSISTFWKIIVAILTLIIAILGIAAKTGCWGLVCR